MRPLDSLPGWNRDPLSRLDEIRTARDELAILTEHAVTEAREAGAPWQDIGDALGISRAAAWERWHNL